MEEAVNEVCALPRSGLWFCVNEVETSGHPIEEIRVWATLHFLAAGSPFCCGEPNCHLGLLGEKLLAVNEHVARAMELEHSVNVEFGDRVGAQYQPGVTFSFQRQSAH